MNELVAIVAIILNILTLLYFFGYWKGKMDTKVGTLWQSHSGTQEALGKIEVKITALWDAYVVSVLAREQQKKNKDVINPSLPKTWRPLVKDICDANLSVGDLGFEIVSRLGIDRIQKTASKHNSSFCEVLAHFIHDINPSCYNKYTRRDDDKK